jgi:hypothetical protein
MPNVLTIDAVFNQMRKRRIRYNVVLSGAYVQAVRGQNVGEVLNLASFTGKFDAEQNWGYTGPKRGFVVNLPGGHAAKILPGADGTHWLLQVFSAAGVELAAAAYPAAILADLEIYVEFEGASYR